MVDPNLHGNDSSNTGLATPEPAPPGKTPLAPIRISRTRIWLHRLSVLLFVFVCAAAGVLLVILPWTQQWSENGLLLRFPSLHAVISNGFVRGICSGLGLLDIWIGFSEAIHYHEEKHA